MKDDESVAQRIADLQELEEAIFRIFIRQLRKLDRKLGMKGILIPKDLCKGIRYYSMIVSTRSILAICACIGRDHL